mgnify:CR=1 FL=1
MSERTAYFVFDIETVVDGRLVQRVRYPGAPELSPSEAVARYRAELMQAKGSDFVPHTFQLPVSIAIAKVAPDYRLQELVSLDRPAFRPHVITEQFWKGWRHYGEPVMVTFNGRGFDLPVLEMAAFRYGISVPGWFKNTGPNWDQPRNRFATCGHIDLQEFLTNFGGVRQSGGLDLCATVIGQPGKMDTKGYMVHDLWEAGEGERIDDYCFCDALDTYFVFLRTRVLHGALSLEDERAIVAEARQLVSELASDNPALQAYLEHWRGWSSPVDSGWAFLDPADQET